MELAHHPVPEPTLWRDIPKPRNGHQAENVIEPEADNAPAELDLAAWHQRAQSALNQAGDCRDSIELGAADAATDLELVNQLAQEVARAGADLSELIRQNQRLGLKAESLDDDLRQNRQTVLSLEENIADLRELIIQKEQILPVLCERKDEAAVTLYRCQKTLKQMEQRLAEVSDPNEAFTLHDNASYYRQEDLRKADNHEQQCRKEYAVCKDAIDGYGSKLASLEEDVRLARAVGQTLIGELAGLSVEINNITRARAELTARLAELAIRRPVAPGEVNGEAADPSDSEPSNKAAILRLVVVHREGGNQDLHGPLANLIGPRLTEPAASGDGSNQEPTGQMAEPKESPLSKYFGTGPVSVRVI
ncbi:MAG: hypothetical protein EOT04_00670 [Candidatus Chaera renei]|uniref:Uncharacterized protein n=1 Tax=Candidatus Chaera renei TaxID=2506947 RepID=A0A4V1J7P3_9BACT|nr:MAG: hypothetical protein EOT04_00670 [Candidatus Chaera renei]